MAPMIQNQNPWWETPQKIGLDPKIEEFEKSKIKWVPDCIEEIAKAAPFSLFILRGPRQVGKTTALKLLIRRLLAEKDKQALFFFDCETLFDGEQLEKAIGDYFKLLDILKIKQTTYIFLDEITSVPDWSKVLKFMIDQGRFKNSVLVISGSNAVDLKKGADRLPGRRGRGREISFLPLSFSEFLEVTNEGGDKYPRVPKEEIFAECSKRLPALPRLLTKMNQYFLTGGFPRLINEFTTNNSIEYSTYEDYLNWIKGEVAKQKREEKKALQLLSELAVVLGSKIGWDTMAKRMGGISHHTIEEYVELFDLLFIGKPLYQIDLTKKRTSWRKSKKFYFVDGLVYILSMALNEKWNNIFDRSMEYVSDPARQGRFIEQVVFSNLVKQGRGWMDPNLSFFSNSSEIDFILIEEKKLLPIEVKWQNQVDFHDFIPMQKLGFKEGMVLSKQTLEKQGDFLIIPAPLYLAMI